MFVGQAFRHFLHNLASILGISWAFFAAHSETLLGRLVADVAGIVGKRNVQLSDWIFCTNDDSQTRASDECAQLSTA